MVKLNNGEDSDISYIYGGLCIADIFSGKVWVDLVAGRAGGLHYQPFLSANLWF